MIPATRIFKNFVQVDGDNTVAQALVAAQGKTFVVLNKAKPNVAKKYAVMSVAALGKLPKTKRIKDVSPKFVPTTMIPRTELLGDVNDQKLTQPKKVFLVVDAAKGNIPLGIFRVKGGILGDGDPGGDGAQIFSVTCQVDDSTFSVNMAMMPSPVMCPNGHPVPIP